MSPRPPTPPKTIYETLNPKKLGRIAIIGPSPARVRAIKKARKA
jgi:hypothetical protein